MSSSLLYSDDLEDLQRFQNTVENSNLTKATLVYNTLTQSYFGTPYSVSIFQNYQDWKELYNAVKSDFNTLIDAKVFSQLLLALQKRADQEERFFDFHTSDFERELFYKLDGRGYVNIWQFLCKNCYLAEPPSAKPPSAKPTSRDELLTFIKTALPTKYPQNQEYLEIILAAINYKLSLEKNVNLISKAELADYIINNFESTKELRTLVRGYIKKEKIVIHNFLPLSKPFEEVVFFIKLNSAFEENLNHLYSVLITLTNFRKNNTKKDLAVYQQCKICWRYVPISFAGNKNKILCHFHNYNEKNGDRFQKAYERGNKLQKERSTPLIQTKILEDYTFLEMPSNDEYEALLNWYDEFLSDPCTAERTLPFETTWGNLDELLEHLPYIKKSADVKNVILDSPLSLIKFLMPENPDANIEEIAQLESMHRIWERNFFVFAHDLDCAENTIREYYRINRKIYFFD